MKLPKILNLFGSGIVKIFSFSKKTLLLYKILVNFLYKNNTNINVYGKNIRFDHGNKSPFTHCSVIVLLMRYLQKNLFLLKKINMMHNEHSHSFQWIMYHTYIIFSHSIKNKDHSLFILINLYFMYFDISVVFDS